MISASLDDWFTTEESVKPDVMPPVPPAIESLSIAGLDLSLTAAGIATECGSRVLKTPAAKFNGPARLARIRDEVMHDVEHASLVVLEGYSFASRVGGEKLGELGGVIRLALWEAEIPFVEIPPSTLKVFGTGKGNAGKGAMLVEAVKRLGYQGSDDNEADALFLRAMGMWAYGRPIVQLPQNHLRGKVLEIEWPKLSITKLEADH